VFFSRAPLPSPLSVSLTPERNCSRHRLKNVQKKKLKSVVSAFFRCSSSDLLAETATRQTTTRCPTGKLLRYTEDGDLEIDNNRAEPSLRPIVVVRRNWLFYGSDKGGRTGAVLSTLIGSCKRLRIEPFAYLRDLFTRISAHPHHRLDELLPDKWALTQKFATIAKIPAETTRSNLRLCCSEEP
jgi:hypothetical protein